MKLLINPYTNKPSLPNVPGIMIYVGSEEQKEKEERKIGRGGEGEEEGG